jgi:hypothetical protein
LVGSSVGVREGRGVLVGNSVGVQVALSVGVGNTVGVTVSVGMGSSVAVSALVGRMSDGWDSLLNTNPIRFTKRIKSTKAVVRARHPSFCSVTLIVYNIKPRSDPSGQYLLEFGKY